MVLQQDQTDCGVACLLSVIRYYGGTNTLQHLRALSGTSPNGTSLLGLCSAAEQLGFDAAGCSSDMAALMAYPHPVILHVQPASGMQHYVVCFGTAKRKHRLCIVIGDPASGIVYLPPEELADIWSSRVCLTLEPGAGFQERNNFRKAGLAWFKDILRPDLPALALACLLGLVISIMGLALAIFSKKLIDDILPSKNLAILYAGLGWVIVLLLIKEMLTWVRQHLLIRQCREFNIRLTGFFFHRLLHLPGSFFNSRRTGEITARFMDASRIQRIISQVATHVVADLLIALGSLACIFIFSLKAGCICLVAVPLLLVFIQFRKDAVTEQQRRIMGGFASAESEMISALQNLVIIKNYNKQSRFFDRYNSIYVKYQEAIVSFGKMQTALSFIINSFCIVLLGAILAVVGHDVIRGRQTAGALMATVSLLSSFLPSLVNLVLTALPVREASVAFDRMFELLYLPVEQTGFEMTPVMIPKRSPGPEHVQPVQMQSANVQARQQQIRVLEEPFKSLQIRRLKFRFPGSRPLFRNIWLDLQKGEMTAIMGENGSGKSTLLHLLQRDYDPESGDININGTISLHDIPLAQWRRIIGVVPQQVRLFNGTVLENIAFEDAHINPRSVIACLEECGLSGFLDLLPQSYKTKVGEGGMILPGGLQQLVAIARAVYHRPQLLILDEATAGMDRAAERLVLSALNRLKKDMAILFVTHRLYVLKNFCEKMYILERGSISACGDHAALLESENFYSQYWKDIFP